MDAKDVWQQLFGNFPRQGTPAAQLTDAERVAIGHASGVPFRLEWESTIVKAVAEVPFGIADDGKGGYVIGIAHRR